MLDSIKILLCEFEGNDGLSTSQIDLLKSSSEIVLPEDYLSFIKYMNGGEGFIGSHYFVAWKGIELEQFNKEYEVNEYAPGIYLFGSNGSGEGFGFCLNSYPYKIVQVPFVGMDLETTVFVADDFNSLLVNMHKSDGCLL